MSISLRIDIGIAAGQKQPIQMRHY
jgi:hypothetical protein